MNKLLFALLAPFLLSSLLFSLSDISCSYDWECEDFGIGEMCLGGICTIPCAQNSDCIEANLWDTCLEGICKSSDSCKTDLECMQKNIGNVCMDGICGYADLPNQCVSDDDCPEGKVCHDFSCISNEGIFCVGDCPPCMPAFLAGFVGIAIFARRVV